jgi:hypothetical protein
VHKSVRLRRFTPEADFSETGIPNDTGESSKFMSLEMRVIMRATALTSITVNVA